jgi:hypothetical protein
MNEAQGMSQGQDISSSPGITSQPAPAPSQAPQTSSEEKTFRQSDVNEIVKKAKYGAVEDYKRLQTEQPNYVQQKNNEGIELQRSHQSPTIASEQDVRRVAAEETQRLRDQWLQEAQTKSEAEHAQRTVQNFWSKVAPGKEKYQDFEAMTGDIEYARFPNVVQLLAEHVDNASDMLYEMGKDRTKMAVLEQLAYMSPKDAIRQAQRMSQSLKDNESAGKMRIPNEPLSQMRPSNTGTDNGVMGVKDYRAKWKV